MRGVPKNKRPKPPEPSALPPDAEALADILAAALVQDFRQHPDGYHGGGNPPPWKTRNRYITQGGITDNLQGFGKCELCRRIFQKKRRRGKVPRLCSDSCRYLVLHSTLETELSRLLVVVAQERNERKERGLDPDKDQDWIRGLGSHWPSYYRRRHGEESQLALKPHQK